MAAIVLFQNREIRRRRIFRERINPLLYMNDQEVEERYRIPRAGIEEDTNDWRWCLSSMYKKSRSWRNHKS